MSGEGATGQVYDATGSVINISDARGSQKLLNPADIKAPEIPEMKKEGGIVQFKILRHLITLLLSSAGIDVVLYAEVYDPASAKHREALSFYRTEQATGQHISLHCVGQSELKCTLHCLNQKMPCCSLFWIWTYLFLR